MLVNGPVSVDQHAYMHGWSWNLSNGETLPITNTPYLFQIEYGLHSSDGHTLSQLAKPPSSEVEEMERDALRFQDTKFNQLVGGSS